MSSGVVSKPNASASGSADFVPPAVALPPSPVVVVLGGGGVYEEMVSKPRACARESAADTVVVVGAACPVSESVVLTGFAVDDDLAATGFTFFLLELEAV
jgi:hypothetical protein